MDWQRILRTCVLPLLVSLEGDTATMVSSWRELSEKIDGAASSGIVSAV